MGRGRQAGAAIGTLGIPPRGASKRVRSAEIGRDRHANVTTGAVGGAPFAATKRVRGVPK
eukprot:7854269-Pyramimonas_sp.AAC.1